MKPQLNCLERSLYLICMLVACSCSNNPRNVPFPDEDAEFKPPVIRKLIFSEPKKFEWVLVNKDSVQAPAITKFDLNEIPSKPFGMGNFQSLLQPVTDTVFEMSAIPDTTFDIDKFPSNKLKFKTAILGQPKRIKTGYPRLKDGASESILVFGQDQGLSGTISTSFFQDKEGIMWLGTDNALCRFDGEYCEIYTIAEGLRSNWITGIFIDSREQIWVRYLGGHGVDVIETKTGLIKHLTVSEGLSNNLVSGFIEDKNGRIWIGTFGGGVNLVDQDYGTISHVGLSEGLSASLLPLMRDSRDRVWINIGGGRVAIIDERARTLKRMGTGNGLISSSVNRVIEYPKGRFWLGTSLGGVQIIDEKSNSLKKLTADHGLSNNATRGIAIDRQGYAWIGTNGMGVSVFNPKDGTIKHLMTAQGLSNNIIMNVFADHNGQIWIGTNAGEISIYDSKGGNLRHLTTTQGLSNQSSLIYGFAEDGNSRKWVSSLGGGVDIIDETSGTLKNLTTAYGLNSNRVSNLLTDKQGRIWVVAGNTIHVIDEKKKTNKNIGMPQGLRPGGGSELLEDSQGLIWLGSNGVNVIEENTGAIKYITAAQGLASNVINSLAENDGGQIWAGLDAGIDVIDKNTGTIRHLNTEHAPGNISVLDLLKDSRGRMWIGSYGNGLHMIDETNGTITSFSIENGLADMVIYSLVERNGSIYVGTGKGLTVLTPKKESTTKDEKNPKNGWSLKSYGKPQGFLRVDFNPRSMVTRDGGIWWGIADVLTIMNEPISDSLAPMPHITALDIMGQPQSFISNKQIRTRLKETDTIWSTGLDTFYTKDNLPVDSGYLPQNNIKWDSTSGIGNISVNLSLPHDQNRLTFHFTGTRLDNLNKTRYRFMLDGNDKGWSEVTDKANAEYRNLSPGRYKFRVSSKGFNGVWSKPAEFSFRIRPPWYQTALAYVLYVLILFGAIIFADRIQRRRLIEKERQRTKDRELAQAREIEKAYHDLKTTQAQLIQAEKMASLGELTAGIAHEIQNPLNFVNNFSEVNKELLTEMKDEIDKANLSEVKSIANNVIENEEKIVFHGKRADGIVKSMLQHSRSSSGRKDPTDINMLADEYLRLSYHGLRAKDKSFNAAFSTDFDPDIGKINIIPQDIGRVLLNLITNAFYSVTEKSRLHPTNYQPEVSVSTKRINGSVQLKVRDNGMGVPQKLLDKIFQPFFTTKPTGQGTGLGLSLSYDIITKSHGGDLKIVTKEGEFAEFIIQLPIQ